MALEKLNNLLSHSDVRVVKAASAASRYLMGTDIVASSSYSGKMFGLFSLPYGECSSITHINKIEAVNVSADRQLYEKELLK